MPVSHCCVDKCYSDSRKKSTSAILKYPWMRDVEFFPLPNAKKQRILRRKWLNVIRRGPKWTPTKYSRICSLHFVEGRPTSENPIPTLFHYNKSARTISKPANRLQLLKKANETTSPWNQSIVTASAPIDSMLDEPQPSSSALSDNVTVLLPAVHLGVEVEIDSCLPKRTKKQNTTLMNG